MPGSDDQSARPERRLPANAWRVMVVGVPVLAAIYLLVPPSVVSPEVLYPLAGLPAIAAFCIALRYGALVRRRAWAAIFTGVALLWTGDVTYSLISLTTAMMPYPSLADAFYLAGYVGLAVGAHQLARGRLSEGDRAPIIDGAIIATGAGAILWIAFIRPSIAGAVDPWVATITMAYPGFDLILLALGVRVLLSGRARPGYLHLILAGLACYFVADVAYSIGVLQGTYVEGAPTDALWIMGVTLWGVAALHPSAAQPVNRVQAGQRLTRSRLAILAVAAMMAPAILLARAVQSGDEMSLGLIIDWTLLFSLVLLRLATTVDELGLSLLQRRRLQDDLVYQAHHDPLTRLANRTLFESRMAAAMRTAPTRTGLVFLDIDDFKSINDTLGHASGDDLLRVFAERIRREVRTGDMASRFGGDEFAVLIEDCLDDATPRAVADRVLSALRAPVVLGERQLTVHASAGVAMGRDGATPIDLVRDADVALYAAKSKGKDRFETYESEMHSHVVRSYQLRTELAEAFEQQRFVVYYQPGLSLETGAAIGAEALVRWRHPERGLLGPADFIPHAESSGLIHDLGLWILREACEAAVGWPASPEGRRATISVNLAPTQLLHPGLVDDVREILEATGLPPNRLALEVTESALVDLDPARRALGRLRDLGVHVALDDFGTGYSALSYLASLPFDVVKLDRSFIAAAADGHRDDLLLAGIVRLCQSLDMITVAEGIEDADQLERVRALGCDIGQGYLFARPMPGPLFADYFAAGTTEHRPTGKARAGRRSVSRLMAAGGAGGRPT